MKTQLLCTFTKKNHLTDTINIIVECKSNNVQIDESVLNQILNYQYKIGAKYLILTNGINTYCLHVNLESKQVNYLDEIPVYLNK